MKHFFTFVIGTLLWNQMAFGQTLFTYGNKEVSKKAFLAAFNKNPPKPTERRKALDEYLGLYINYKLKVQAGYDEQLDKLPTFEQESKNFRKQIADNVINEEVGIKHLSQEALERSYVDIKAAQIFVEIPKNGDTVAAFKQINAAYSALQSGKSFEQVAVNFSSDEETKKSKGNLGFITVFTLGYEYENQIYNLKSGNYSKPYRSSIGYHIFKNNGQRPALGKRKIAHILIAAPAGFESTIPNQYSQLADSVFQLLNSGQAFEKLAQEYSNDYKTANVGGVVGEIGVGQYDSLYESKVFGLKNIGDITKPFATAYGYHIIKLLEKKAIDKTIDQASALSAIKQIVEKDERLALNKKKQLIKWLQLTKYQPSKYDTKALKQYTDSNIENKITNGIKNIHDTTLLFSFEKKKIYAADWAVYASKTLTQTQLDYTETLKEFANQKCVEYYTENLELYNESMHDQCREFDEANLLFAAMDNHVWSKAGEDTGALKKYYQQHKENYQWQPSVAAIIINAKTKELATEVAAKIKSAPSEWHSLADTYGADVNADSNRYELSQLPIKQNIDAKAGYISTIEKSSTDEGYSFMYVTNSFPQKAQRTFQEAKGMVINDYQQLLEKQWIDALKKKYPITVNQSVWKTVQ